jgi:HEAT repeat protein
MGKRISFEQELAQLKRIARSGTCDEADVACLRRTLAGANPLLVAKAAKAVSQLRSPDLLPELGDAFNRFMSKGAKEDKGCVGKTALAEALDALGYESAEPFFRGVRYIQLESVYGGRADTAARLRSVCAAGLVRTGRREEVLIELTSLLMDGEPEPRRVAAQNLGFAVPSEASELVLRLKVLAGDEVPDVLGDCFSSLLHLAPQRSMEFVTGYLSDNDPDVAQAAAIALAQSQGRQPAVDILINAFMNDFRTEYKENFLAAIALARIPPAIDFLEKVIADEHPTLAAAAIRAMAIYRSDEQLKSRARGAVLSRGLPMLQEEFDKSFQP